jgi:thymidine kinase
MQPLYVGKTKNLQRRCTQHSNGDGNEKTFRSRFEMFSRVNKLRARSVDDLLYLTIDTQMDKVDDCLDVNLEDVLEEVMKRVCQPPYSKR